MPATVDQALRRPGTYALLLEPNRQRTGIEIGARGRLLMKKSGSYIYVGSAHGPGGLAGRLSHHLRRVNNPHWHVDYLRRACSIRGVLIVSGARQLEHDWFRKLRLMPSAEIPMSGFGSSDCRCAAHLVYIASRVPVRLISEAVASGGGPLPRYLSRLDLDQSLL